MKEENITVSKEKFDEMIRKVSCQSICEKGQASGIVKVKDKNYVITGFASSGLTGYIQAWGNEIVSIDFYSGKLKPLEYGDHNNDDKRPIGYNGMLIRAEGKKVVMIGESITFIPNKENQQLSLF